MVLVGEIPRATITEAGAVAVQAAINDLRAGKHDGDLLQACIWNGCERHVSEQLVSLITAKRGLTHGGAGSPHRIAYTFPTGHRRRMAMLVGSAAGFLLSALLAWTSVHSPLVTAGLGLCAALLVHETAHGLVAEALCEPSEGIGLGLVWVAIPVVWIRLPSLLRARAFVRCLIWFAGPAANVFLGTWLAMGGAAMRPGGEMLISINLLAAGINLLPWGPRDGLHIVASATGVVRPWQVAASASPIGWRVRLALAACASIGVLLCVLAARNVALI